MEAPPDGTVYNTHGYGDQWWDPDSLVVPSEVPTYLRTSWVVLGVPVAVGANVLVEATEESAEFVYTPVRVRIVRVGRAATAMNRDDIVAGAEITVAVPGGTADGRYFESGMSTYDKGALAAGGVFALEISDYTGYPGLSDELLLSRAFELNASDLTSLQLGHGDAAHDPSRVPASAIRDGGLQLSAQDLRQMATGEHREVQAVIASE